jgi:hypothetical protein
MVGRLESNTVYCARNTLRQQMSMKVTEVMVEEVKFCGPGDTLNRAA